MPAASIPYGPLLLLCLLLHGVLRAQSTVPASGEATAVLRDDVARSVQVQALLMEARLQALRSVSGVNLLLAEQLARSQKVTGKDKETRMHYLREVNTFTTGRWIMDRREPVLTKTMEPGGTESIHVKVDGYVLAENTPYAMIRYTLSDSKEEGNHTCMFTAGEPLYLRFTADRGGWLSVILEDPITDSAYVLQDVQGFPLQVKAYREVRIPDVTANDYYYELITDLNQTATNTLQYLWLIFSETQDALPLEPQPDRVPVTTVKVYRTWLYQTVGRNSRINILCIPISINPAVSYEKH